MEQNRDVLSVSNSILVAGFIIAAAILFTGSDFSPKQQVAAVAETKTSEIKIIERRDAPQAGNGKVVIYEFSDFQCPYCQQFWATTYKQLKSEYIDTNKVTFVYRQLPIASIHPFAQKAAEASECANDQGKFFEYHDELFANGKSNGAGLDILSLKSYAANLGLNTNEFNLCLDGGKKADAVASDLEAAQGAGITGTPTFIINGKKYVGALPYAQFKQIIDSELK